MIAALFTTATWITILEVIALLFLGGLVFSILIIVLVAIVLLFDN